MNLAHEALQGLDAEQSCRPREVVRHLCANPHGVSSLGLTSRGVSSRMPDDLGR